MYVIWVHICVSRMAVVLSVVSCGHKVIIWVRTGCLQSSFLEKKMRKSESQKSWFFFHGQKMKRWFWWFFLGNSKIEEKKIRFFVWGHPIQKLFFSTLCFFLFFWETVITAVLMFWSGLENVLDVPWGRFWVGITWENDMGSLVWRGKPTFGIFRPFLGAVSDVSGET